MTWIFCFLILTLTHPGLGAPQPSTTDSTDQKEPSFIESHNSLLKWLDFFNDFTKTTEKPPAETNQAIVETVGSTASKPAANPNRAPQSLINGNVLDEQNSGSQPNAKPPTPTFGGGSNQPTPNFFNGPAFGSGSGSPPPRPTFNNQPSTPTFNYQAPTPAFNNAPPTPTFNNQPTVPTFNTNQPPTPTFNNNQPPTPTFNNQPPTPTFNNQPPTPTFNNQPSTPTPAFNNQPPAPFFNQGMVNPFFVGPPLPYQTISNFGQYFDISPPGPGTFSRQPQSIQEAKPSALSSINALGNDNNCDEKTLTTMIGQDTQSLPTLRTLPGSRCYVDSIFESGKCVESTCTQVRLCRSTSSRIVGNCGDSKLCCMPPSQ